MRLESHKLYKKDKVGLQNSIGTCIRPQAATLFVALGARRVRGLGTKSPEAKVSVQMSPYFVSQRCSKYVSK